MNMMGPQEFICRNCQGEMSGGGGGGGGGGGTKLARKLVLWDV